MIAIIQSKQVTQNMLSAFCFDSELDNTYWYTEVCGEAFQNKRTNR
jgi:hypothetical protein